MELTKSELEIMDVLWEAGEPLSRSDLLERSEVKNWKDSSVHILLNGLLRKAIIEEVGFVKRSKTYGRTFQPTMSREAYYAQAVYGHTYRPELTGLIAELLTQQHPDAATLEKIDELIQKQMGK